MKKKITIHIFLMLSLMLFVACSATEEESTNPVVEDTTEDSTEEEQAKASIEVQNIQTYENIFMTDWLDDNQVVALKENEELDTLTLEELSEQHPTSIYGFDVESEEMTLILGKENVNLGDAKISPNRTYLLYSEYTLGDPAYYIYNLNSDESFSLSGDPIGGAMSAKWVKGNEVIGTAYAGGLFRADIRGEVDLVEEITEEMIYLIEEMDNTIFYNTGNNPSLIAYNLETQESVSLPFNDVRDMIASPSGEHLLIVDGSDTGVILYLYDSIEETQMTLAEGVSISGISVSTSGRRIAYVLTSEDAVEGTLFVEDLALDAKEEIADGINYGTTSWSPSENQLIYTSYDGEDTNSSIVTFAE